MAKSIPRSAVPNDDDEVQVVEVGPSKKRRISRASGQSSKKQRSERDGIPTAVPWSKSDEDSDSPENEPQNRGCIFVAMVEGCRTRNCADAAEREARRKRWYEEEERKLRSQGLTPDGPPVICPDGMSIPWRRIIPLPQRPQAAEETNQTLDGEGHGIGPLKGEGRSWPFRLDVNRTSIDRLETLERFISSYSRAQISGPDAIMKLYDPNAAVSLRCTEVIPVRAQLANIVNGRIVLSRIERLAEQLGLERGNPGLSNPDRPSFLRRTFQEGELAVVAPLLLRIPLRRSARFIDASVAEPRRNTLVTVHDHMMLEDIGPISFDRSILLDDLKAGGEVSILWDTLTFRQPSLYPAAASEPRKDIASETRSCASGESQSTGSSDRGRPAEVLNQESASTASYSSSKALGKRRAVGERPAEDLHRESVLNQNSDSESERPLASSNALVDETLSNPPVSPSSPSSTSDSSSDDAVVLVAPNQARPLLSRTKPASRPSLTIPPSSHVVSGPARASQTAGTAKPAAGWKEEETVFRERCMKSAELPKYGHTIGRRLLRYGSDLVAVSHRGQLDYVTSSTRRWDVKKSYALSQGQKSVECVYDAAVCSRPRCIVVPYGRITQTDDTAAQVALFTWPSEGTAPQRYTPTQRPHDSHGVRAVTASTRGFFSGGFDHGLVSWTLNEEGRIERVEHLKSEHKSTIYSLVASSQWPWLYSAGNGPKKSRLSILDLVKNDVVRHLPFDNQVVQLHEHPARPGLIIAEASKRNEQFEVYEFEALALDHRTPLSYVARFGYGTLDTPISCAKGACWADVFAKGIGDWTARVWDIRNPARFQDAQLVRPAPRLTNPMAHHMLLDSSGLTALRGNFVTFHDWSWRSGSKGA